MSGPNFPTPELNVFLIASHVVYGYVGNKTASLVLQVLGCNVSALNTVHFSNHTGYRQWQGTKQTGDDLRAVYEGLKKNDLVDFDMMLTGYCPGPEAVEAAGFMARELRTAATMRPGSFFWILDPVMGDDGALYVDPAVVPIYRNLIDHADLIVPNQFELQTLAGNDTHIDSFASMLQAIETIHREHRTPHVLVTSVRFSNDKDGDGDGTGTSSGGSSKGKLSVVGSTRTSDSKPRAFKIEVPEFECTFAGTGDLFASLMTVRLREAAEQAGLLQTQSWISPDDVDTLHLPLAKAAEKALASMHAVLEKTMVQRNRMMTAAEGDLQPHGDDKKLHLKRTKAAEVRIVRNVADLLYPKELFKAEALHSFTLPHKREHS